MKILTLKIPVLLLVLLRFLFHEGAGISTFMKIKFDIFLRFKVVERAASTTFGKSLSPSPRLSNWISNGFNSQDLQVEKTSKKQEPEKTLSPPKRYDFQPSFC